MSTGTTERLFATTNLDPALAEAVEAGPADRILEGIIRLEDPDQVPPGFQVVSRFHRICTGRFAAGLTWTIRRHPNAISLKVSRPLGLHDDGVRAGDPFNIQSWTRTENEPLPFRGRGCIVAALDFGLDFAHPNFLNSDGTTRLLAFWDQGAAYDPAHPNRFGYGRQYTPAEINAALRAADPYRALGYSPQQSDTGKGSHGTYTLDIAAGNGRAAGSRPGAACDAGLMFVHLSTRRLGTSENLGDSVRLLEALDWVDEAARGRPWAVNLSVGSTNGSHDGTSPVEQGLHELLRRGEGKAVIQSAGNYRSADLAVHGHLVDGEHRDLSWIIDPADTTPNELDAWYSGKDRFMVALHPPQGADFLRVRLGEVAAIVHDGAVMGRIYHRKNDPNNGDNHVEIFLYTNAPPGTWTLRLTGDYVIDGRYHAWIERDLAKPGAQSRFDPSISSPAYTLGTIATSPLVITVGAYNAHAEDASLASFSSCGPTRDERHDKPELLAPGVDVLAARSIPRGAVRQEGLLIERSGTSMAAPHVTGVVAALFEAAGRPVSIEVIRQCLKRSARPHLHTDDGDCCAWGRLDAAAAIRAMLTYERRGARQAGRSACEGRGDVMTYNLDRAEQVLQSTAAGKYESETAFLQGLLHELDPDAALDISPAQLLRDFLRRGRVSERMRRVLEIVARPFEQPGQPLRPGDVMLRAIPGTGDLGHVMVLVSGDLRTPAALAADGITAESTVPGQYGTVVEAGAFPHRRSAPYARRWLDGRGRVPPHSLILRPKSPPDDPYLDFPVQEPAQEPPDDSETLSSPAWLRGERRSADPPGSAAQPKLYAESAPGFEEQATPSPTKTRVSDQFAIPFRWMARVSLRKRGSEESHGSGVLISDVHVLTAAHVVWNATVSPAEYSVEVTLAQDGNTFLDRFSVSRIDIPKLYKHDGHAFDYSILTLNSPVADRTYKDLGGARLCYWGSSTCGAGTTAEPVNPASLNGQVAITAGYPGDKGGNQMWVVTGTMSRSVGGTAAIHYTGELIEGQSGSPAWIEQNGVRNIVGLVVSRGTFNRLYPLTWEMVGELNGWMLRAERTPGRRTESEAETEVAGDQMEERVTGETPALPPWLKTERRRQTRSAAAEFEAYAEGFTFDPTGAQTDFGPRLRKLWHKMLKDAFEANLDDATTAVKDGLKTTLANATKHIRFFSQASRPASVTLSEANVSWRALPTRKGPPSRAIYKFFDEPLGLRDQDEYCEWKVFKNSSSKVVRVVFTSEPPEYYHFLYDPSSVDPAATDLVKFARGLLVRLYQERCGSKSITLADLEAGGTYDPGNKWNNDYCVHLQQPNNTLGAQLNIAARASVVRSSSGTIITDVKTLIGCDPFGEPDRQSDPTIGDNVNKLARQNRFLTLANPVGLYMSGLDTSGWTTPDGTDAQTFWKVLKGKVDKDPHKSMIVRAEFAVPASKKYTVSDIKIGGVPIEFGSQIAEQLEMRLGALYGPVDKDPEGRKTSAPTPVPC